MFALGKYVMDHMMGGGAGGRLEGYEDKMTTGNRPNGIYLARFSNVKKPNPDFVRGFAYQGGAGRGRALILHGLSVSC